MTFRTITFDDSIYKLVPLEPTEEMLSSAWEYHGSSRYSERVLQDAVTDAECYKAMIAAAPEYQEPDSQPLAAQAQQSQWISVEERLPETYIADDRELIVLGKHIGASIKSDDVLVLLKTGKVKMDRLAGIVGNEPFWWIYRNLVVSWMPLPPAPEAKE